MGFLVGWFESYRFGWISPPNPTYGNQIFKEDDIIEDETQQFMLLEGYILKVFNIEAFVFIICFVFRISYF